jgi:hypothetical protein
MPPMLAHGVSIDTAASATLLAVVFGVHALNFTEFGDEGFPGLAHVLSPILDLTVEFQFMQKCPPWQG